VGDDAEQEDEELAHQRKKAHQKRKGGQRKHREHESVENNEKERDT
jgi:hypothetical protein